MGEYIVHMPFDKMFTSEELEGNFTFYHEGKYIAPPSFREENDIIIENESWRDVFGND